MNRPSVPGPRGEDPARLRLPEPVVGRVNDDREVGGRPALRVLDRAGEFLRAIGERDSRAGDFLVRFDVEREVEDVAAGGDRGLEDPLTAAGCAPAGAARRRGRRRAAVRRRRHVAEIV